MVVGAQGGEEGVRDLGGEGVDGGGVGGDSDGGVRAGLDLGGGGAVEEQEVPGGGEDRALEAVQVAVAVLEADDAGDRGQAPDGLGGVGDLTPLVGDQREPGPGGDPLHLRDQSVLRGGGEVVRHDEKRVGAGVLGDAGEPQGLRPAVPGPGDDGHPAGRLLDGNGHDPPVLVLVQGEELAGAAGGEERAGPGGEPVGDVGAVSVGVEGAVLAEAGQRERQHARRHAFAQPPDDGGPAGVAVGQPVGAAAAAGAGAGAGADPGARAGAGRGVGAGALARRLHSPHCLRM
ncbi:hypothetical protein STENM223S_03747 [Streptomyces tendae]